MGYTSEAGSRSGQVLSVCSHVNAQGGVIWLDGELSNRASGSQYYRDKARKISKQKDFSLLITTASISQVYLINFKTSKDENMARDSIENVYPGVNLSQSHPRVFKIACKGGLVFYLS